MEDLTACECPICFLDFDETRLPMSTPCGHTFCKPCLFGLADSVHHRGNKVICCPFCREFVHIESVHTNVTLRQLIEQIKRLRRGTVGLPSSGGSTSPSPNSLFSLQFEDLNLMEPLDSGAYGEVHRGMWKESEVAIKVFHMGRLSSRSLTSFKAEFVVMSCMRHPNVVLLMGACEHPRPCIVMEFMRGGSLHSVIHNKKQVLSLENVVMVAQDIGRGLQYLHSINILHRDLKSKNVLMSGDLPCQAKICDFGLAKVRQESATMTGNIGTVSWTAPEVLNNVRYHFAADIYSFGMTLVEMANGDAPFSHMMPIAVVMAVAVRKEKPRISDAVNKDLKDLILGCIQWDGDSRLSILQILKKLDEMAPTKRQPLKRQQSSMDHNESLGVLYLTVSSMGADSRVPNDQVDSRRPIGQSSMDQVLANQLQQEEESERQRMIEADWNLAEQLQQKDYSIQAPILAKEVEESNWEQLPKIVKESHNKARVPPTSTGKQPVKGPRERKSSEHLPAPPPVPPAPPPILASVRTPKAQRKNQSMGLNIRSNVELSEVIRLFPKVKLKSVETVEKRIAKIGRVVDNVEGEVRMHPIVRAEIEDFDKCQLLHVVPPRPPPLSTILGSEYMYPPTVAVSKSATKSGKSITYYPALPVPTKTDVLKKQKQSKTRRTSRAYYNAPDGDDGNDDLYEQEIPDLPSYLEFDIPLETERELHVATTNRLSPVQKKKHPGQQYSELAQQKKTTKQVSQPAQKEKKSKGIFSLFGKKTQTQATNLQSKKVASPVEMPPKRLSKNRAAMASFTALPGPDSYDSDSSSGTL